MPAYLVGTVQGPRACQYGSEWEELFVALRGRIGGLGACKFGGQERRGVIDRLIVG